MYFIFDTFLSFLREFSSRHFDSINVTFAMQLWAVGRDYLLTKNIDFEQREVIEESSVWAEGREFHTSSLNGQR